MERDVTLTGEPPMTWRRARGRGLELWGWLCEGAGALLGDEPLALRGAKLRFLGRVQARAEAARRTTEGGIDALLRRLYHFRAP